MAPQLLFINPIVADQTREAESAMLERIRSRSLLSWLFEASSKVSQRELFMNSVCQTLASLQEKGLIQGYRESLMDGCRMPVVGKVSLTTQQVQAPVEPVAPAPVVAAAPLEPKPQAVSHSAEAGLTRFYGRPGRCRVRMTEQSFAMGSPVAATA
jgi:hypothetical protein